MNTIFRRSFDSSAENKEKCLSSMRTLSNQFLTNLDRATLKIEIPFTDHAHCIGRQGNQIQSIMSATDTHIHFPDGNREPNGTKSNQVSITGTIVSIELARKRIRDILPMSLKFLIPPTQLINIINDDYPLFRHVRTRFGVMVLPRPYAKTGDVYCIVRGLINQAGLAEATDHLIQAFYGFEAPLVKVTCQTEVSEQYHVYLQTRQQSKDMCIAAIEQYTHTAIQFPTKMTNEQSTMATISANGYARRTSVTITGSPAHVCQARKLFDLCLPIILTFEIPTDKEPSRAHIAQIQDKLNVATTVRVRKDKIGKLISVQSQEYNSDQLFRARCIILGQADTSNDRLGPMPSFSSTDDFEPNSSATFSPDLSGSSTSSSSFRLSTSTSTSNSRMKNSSFIPTELSYVPASSQPIDTFMAPVVETIKAKKPSPIGHERSSSRHPDQDTSVWPMTNDPFSSLLLFDSPTLPMGNTFKSTAVQPPQSIDKSLTRSPSSSLLPADKTSSTKLLALLRSLHLEKYWSTFERHEIDYDKFLSLTEHDLNNLGIETFGACRRMQQAINMTHWPLLFNIIEENNDLHDYAFALPQPRSTALDFESNPASPVSIVDDFNSKTHMSHPLPSLPLLSI